MFGLKRLDARGNRIEGDSAAVWVPHQEKTRTAEQTIALINKFLDWYRVNGPADWQAQPVIYFEIGGNEVHRAGDWLQKGQPNPINLGDLHLGKYEDVADVDDLEVKHFEIATQPIHAAGGCSPDSQKNCCLLYAIDEAAKIAGIKSVWRNDYITVKSWLKLGETEKIPWQMVPCLEQALQRIGNPMSIKVFRGEEMLYGGCGAAKSSGVAAPTVAVELVGDHYVIAATNHHKPAKLQYRGDPLSEFKIPRCPLLCWRVGRPGEPGCPPDKRYQYFNTLGTSGEIREETHVGIHKMAVELKNAAIRYCKTEQEARKEMKEWHQAREEMLLASGGRIDLFSRAKYVDIAVDSWLALNCMDFEPFPREQENWLEDAIMGGVICSRPGNVKRAVQVDVNAFYPHLMQRKNCGRVPLQPGTWKRRCLRRDSLQRDSPDIWQVELQGIRAPWRSNKKNLYRESELKRLLSVFPDAAPDGIECQTLHWETSQCAEMAQLFEPWVKFWLEIETEAKKRKLEHATKMSKLISRCLWGVLSQRRAKEKSLPCTVALSADERILSLCSHRTKPGWMRLRSLRASDSLFAGMLPAVGYSILSIGRVWLCNNMKFWEDKGLRWRRAHTDGVVLELSADSPKLADVMKISKKVGEFKEEKTGSCYVRNCMMVHW